MYDFLLKLAELILENRDKANGLFLPACGLIIVQGIVSTFKKAVPKEGLEIIKGPIRLKKPTDGQKTEKEEEEEDNKKTTTSDSSPDSGDEKDT